MTRIYTPVHQQKQSTLIRRPAVRDGDGRHRYGVNIDLDLPTEEELLLRSTRNPEPGDHGRRDEGRGTSLFVARNCSMNTICKMHS